MCPDSSGEREDTLHLSNGREKVYQLLHLLQGCKNKAMLLRLVAKAVLDPKGLNTYFMPEQSTPAPVIPPNREPSDTADSPPSPNPDLRNNIRKNDDISDPTSKPPQASLAPPAAPEGANKHLNDMDVDQRKLFLPSVTMVLSFLLH